MTKLSNLPDYEKKGDVEALLIFEARSIYVALNNSIPATFAGSKGAINVYTDINGKIHCEAMEHCISVEIKKYTSAINAFKWAHNKIMQYR